MTVVPLERDLEPRLQDQGSSAAKALTVLEVVINADGGVLGVTDVALASGLPRSTAHRLLTTLVERGFVEHVASKYRVGGRFFELSEYSRRSCYGDLRDLAADHLEQLFEATGATVLLGVLDGRDLLYVEKINGPGGCRHPARVGGRGPVTATALGKAMLAFSPAGVIEQHLRVPLPRPTPYAVAAPGLLRDQLVETRRTGVAFDHEECRLGFAAVAAPIVVGREVRAAVSVTVPLSGGASIERHAAAVRDSARRIAGDLRPVPARSGR
jgi:DNA-binding IclR family transcriptional regulator